ncbi:uncharacterized protein EHS24_005285 [Apiotrichum porosum]|uniref:Amino acid permease/ SLC12A domain-containing protein n=1 Tax=Apiotrichum porosum TaxID=105984 RepID=A0A427XCV3_9TREE|nr:uncharacterized protein EHS24_005285 [Apiotrichum porosum]RSH76709.1 hypothetical protein EHS24_005285 [Apiotrichum porosum]
MTVETVAPTDTKHLRPGSPSLSSSKEAGNVTIVAHEEDLDGDAGLHELGYKAELHRTRGFMDVLPCRSPWTIAFSLGELASRWPTSAGAYYWTFQLAPKRFRTVLSYINGWLLLTAVLLTTTSVAFGISQHIVATVNIVHPDWSPAQWVYILIAYALLALAAIPLLMNPRYLTFMEKTNVIVTWVYKFAHIIVLSARAKAGRRSAKYAFTHYEPQLSGWGDVWTFFIGFLPGAYANCAPGFVLAMTEEVHKPETNVPRAMAYSMMPASFVLAWAFILPLTFTMPSSEVLLEAPNGIVLPYAYKLIVGNDAGAILLMLGILYIGFNCLVGINTTASRQLWSFSRDHAVPGSAIWSRVTPSGNVPYAIALCLVVQCLLCLIDLGSTTAFNSSSARLSTPSWLPTRFPSSSASSRAARASRLHLSRGASMPAVIPVTAQTMNYSSVVLGGFITIASVWYLVYARRVYKGPPASAELH